MVFSFSLLARVAAFFLAVCGFAIARHIHKHKKPEHGPLICPVGFDCNTVVHSDYSKFLGMHLEVIGMAYFAAISILYFALIFLTGPIASSLSLIALVGSAGSFVFSLYLISVQAFILKKGCSWCLTEAAISILIFLLLIAVTLI